MTRHHPEFGVCNRCPRRTDLMHCEGVDEYLCEECIISVAETALVAAQTMPRCDNCDKPMPVGTHENEYGELICPSCGENAAEAAYDRQQAANLESPPESMREEQLRTWAEHQEAHKRGDYHDGERE